MLQLAIPDPTAWQLRGPGEQNRRELERFYRPSYLVSACSSERTARLRERRVQMGLEKRTEPPDYTKLAADARQVYLQYEAIDPALARANALLYVAEHCEITIEPDTLLLGGENPFLFNLLLPALQADQYARGSE